MSSITLKQLTKTYENASEATIKGIDLDINDGEFVAFVGPSGCGKSTTLRMIAGLESISDGEIRIDDKVVNDVLPRDRNIAMVFQNYALYPHKTVYKNISFGLKMKKTPPDVIEQKVAWASDILGITDQLDKKPKDLSGGQRQRVALARAIVKESGVFLMDEPLSNLDAKLRVSTRKEIIALHRALKSTFIYVTHDQIEAMTMADKIVVMNKGEIKQVGTPKELYNKPINLFVATFIGTPAMNIIKVSIDQDKVLLPGGQTIVLPEGIVNKLPVDKKEFLLGIRPEDIVVTKVELEAYKDLQFEVDVVHSELVGRTYNVYAKVGEFDLIMDTSNEYNLDEKITVALKPSKIHMFDIDTEMALLN